MRVTTNSLKAKPLNAGNIEVGTVFEAKWEEGCSGLFLKIPGGMVDLNDPSRVIRWEGLCSLVLDSWQPMKAHLTVEPE